MKMIGTRRNGISEEDILDGGKWGRINLKKRLEMKLRRCV